MDAAGDDELVQAVVARLRNFVWGLLRPADAEELARAAQAEARSDAARDVLRAALAWALVFSDRPADALAVLEALGADERRGGELRAIAEACALVANGRAERAATVARRGREIHIATSADVDRPGTHLATEVFALVECGRLAEAFEIGEAGYQVARQQRHPDRPDPVHDDARPGRAGRGHPPHREAVAGRVRRAVRQVPLRRAPPDRALRPGHRQQLAGRARPCPPGRRRSVRACPPSDS